MIVEGAVRARRAGRARRCAYCHGEEGELAWRCGQCRTVAHMECVGAHGRCVTIGCSGRRPGVGERWGAWLEGVWSDGLLVALAVAGVVLVGLG